MSHEVLGVKGLIATQECSEVGYLGSDGSGDHGGSDIICVIIY